MISHRIFDLGWIHTRLWWVMLGIPTPLDLLQVSGIPTQPAESGRLT